MGVFRNIEGTFNNLSLHSMIAAVSGSGVGGTITRLIEAYICSRIVKAILNGATVQVAVGNGCLQ